MTNDEVGKTSGSRADWQCRNGREERGLRDEVRRMRVAVALSLCVEVLFLPLPPTSMAFGKTGMPFSKCRTKWTFKSDCTEAEAFELLGSAQGISTHFRGFGAHELRKLAKTMVFFKLTNGTVRSFSMPGLTGPG